jgi:hypothetical protein
MGVWKYGSMEVTFNLISHRSSVIDQLVFSDKNHTDNK